MKKTTLKLSTIIAGAALFATTLFPSTIAFAEDPSPETSSVQITQGYVYWNIKDSWLGYISKEGTILSDGVEWGQNPFTGSESLQWSIKNGTYDPETKSLDLELNGTARFIGYCEENKENCLLDSTFKNLSVRLTSREQTIRGTYRGVDREDIQGGIHEHEGVLATLDAYEKTPMSVMGSTIWQLNTAAGKDLTLYPDGTELAPIIIYYAGPGEAPDFQERLKPEGFPSYKVTAEYVADDLEPGNSSFAFQEFIYKPGSEIFPLVQIQKSSSDYRDSDVFVTMLDTNTLKPLGKTKYERRDDQPSLMSSSYAPEIQTLFLSENSRNDDKGILSALKWNAEKKNFEIKRIYTHAFSPADPNNPRIGFPSFGTFIHWDDRTKRLMVLTADDDKNKETYELLFFRADNGDFDLDSREQVEVDLAEGAEFPVRGAQTSHLVTRGDQKYIYLGTAYPIMLEKRAQKWHLETSSDIVKAIKPSFNHSCTSTYSTWHTPQTLPDSSIFMPKSSVGYSILSPDGEIKTLPVYCGIALEGGFYDVNYNFVAIPDLFNDRLHIYRDFERQGSIALPFHFKYGITQNSVYLDDNAVLYSAYRSDTVSEWQKAPMFLARLELEAVTATLTKQPQNVSLALSSDSASQKISFDVDYSALGDTTVQWQKKAPGEQDYKPIEGATEKHLEQTVTTADDGTQYRAIMRNKAGAVSSQEATLEVKLDSTTQSDPNGEESNQNQEGTSDETGTENTAGETSPAPGNEEVNKTPTENTTTESETSPQQTPEKTNTVVAPREQSGSGAASQSVQSQSEPTSPSTTARPTAVIPSPTSRPANSSSALAQSGSSGASTALLACTFLLLLGASIALTRKIRS